MNDLDQYMKNVSSEVRRLWTVKANCESQTHEMIMCESKSSYWKLWLSAWVMSTGVDLWEIRCLATFPPLFEEAKKK